MAKFMKVLPIYFNTTNKGKIKTSINSTDESSSNNSNSKLHESLVLRNMSCWTLVWLDTNIDEINDQDCQNTLTELRKVANTVNTFVDIDQCIDFLRNHSDTKILLIVSGSVGQDIIPRIHNISHLISIYIFCADQSKHEQWSKHWSKIEGVFTEIRPICNELEQVEQQDSRNSIPISFVQINDQISTDELNQLDQSFMHTKILIESLFDIEFSRKKSIKDFTDYCRRLFVSNQKELKMINKLAHEYSKFPAIWWYSNECFIHRMLNQALRLMDVDIILKMGFFIRDLHEQIKDLHHKQFIHRGERQVFTVYRGQGLCKTDFDKIIQTKGGLISFNTFLSTSKKENVARIYARHAKRDSELVGIVFKMVIDTQISSTPFALINDFSFYKASEQEILFSMHTVFRIGDTHLIESENSQLWEVELILTSDNDEQLNKLIEQTRKENQGSKGWFRVGQLLITLGKFNKAEELYVLLLNQTPKKMERACIHHQLGWIKVHMGSYTEAISFFEESLSISKTIFPLNYQDLATCYDNMGLVYDHMGKYRLALLFHRKAFKIYQATFSSNHPDLATSLNNIASIYSKLNDYPNALLFYDEALQIYQKNLPPNHSSLAILYNNIGLVHDKNNDFSKAFWYYDKTLTIYRNTMPKNHPDLATLHQNIGNALKNMCEYTKALSHYEKALSIFENNFPPDHPYLATCFMHIASVYINMNEYYTALPWCQRAHDIRQAILPMHHPDLIAAYHSMAEIYHRMNEYLQALPFYEKLFQISQRILAPDNPLLANAYYKMSKIYFDMNCYTTALPYIEQAISIAQCTLPSNHSTLQTYVQTLELISCSLNINKNLIVDER